MIEQLDSLLIDRQKNLPKIKAILRQRMRKGQNISGYYTLIQSLGSTFRKEFGRWARRRGRSLEERVTLQLECAFRDGGYRCKAYRSANERCATQLYDVVLYVNDRPPFFIECKAGGVVRNTRGLRLESNHRAMKNFSVRLELLKEIALEVNPPYIFYFAGGDIDYAVPLRELIRTRAASENSNKIQVYYEIKSPADLIKIYETEISLT